MGPFANVCPAVGQIGGGQGTSLVFPSSQLLLAQNNPYAKVVYFGVV